MELATNSNAQSTPIPDRWEDSMQVAGVPPLWGALAALAALVGKKATQKIMKKMIDAGVKDPKKQQQLIKKQIEKVKGKGAGDAAIAAGEVALNEYLHYTKKQEEAGEPRNKLAHHSSQMFPHGEIRPGRDGLIHLSEERIEGRGRNDQFYRSSVDLEDMPEFRDSEGWSPKEILTKAMTAGVFSEKEEMSLLKSLSTGDAELFARDLKSALSNKGVKAFKYKNAYEGSWDYADRHVQDTYSVGVIDPKILNPSASFLNKHTGLEANLGDFAPEDYNKSYFGDRAFYHGPRVPNRLDRFVRGGDIYWTTSKKNAEFFADETSHYLDIAGEDERVAISRDEATDILNMIEPHESLDWLEETSLNYTLEDDDDNEYARRRDAVEEYLNNRYSRSLNDSTITVRASNNKVIKSKLNVKNPYVKDYGGRVWGETDTIIEFDLKEARDRGHDAFIARNIVEGGMGANEEFELGDTVVVFDASQTDFDGGEAEHPPLRDPDEIEEKPTPDAEFVKKHQMKTNPYTLEDLRRRTPVYFMKNNRGSLESGGPGQEVGEVKIPIKITPENIHRLEEHYLPEVVDEIKNKGGWYIDNPEHGTRDVEPIYVVGDMGVVDYFNEEDRSRWSSKTGGARWRSLDDEEVYNYTGKEMDELGVDIFDFRLRDFAPDKIERFGAPLDDWYGDAPRFDWEESDNFGVWDESNVREWSGDKESAIYRSMVDLSDVEYSAVEEGEEEIEALKKQYLDDPNFVATDVYSYAREQGLLRTDLDSEDIEWVAENLARETAEREALFRTEEDAGSGRYPPILMERDANGNTKLLDGNHRVKRWKEEGLEVAPAIIIDKMNKSGSIKF